MRRRNRLVVALAAVAAVCVAYYNVPGRVTGDALLMSMYRHSIAGAIICTRTGEGEDRACEFVAGGDSDGLGYDVTVTGRCWKARRVEEPPPKEGNYEPYTPQPARYSGCVVIGDNIRPLGRFVHGSGYDDVQPDPTAPSAR
ncbi:MAG: hypothetical protein ABIO67_06250 [Mycobacteriales bacterium]